MPENHYIDKYYVIEDLAAKGGMKIERYRHKLCQNVTQFALILTF